MDDMFGMQYSISVENQPYPVLCTLSPDGCTIHVPDFPKIEVQTLSLIHILDPGCMVMVTETGEVYGEGFVDPGKTASFL